MPTFSSHPSLRSRGPGSATGVWKFARKPSTFPLIRFRSSEVLLLRQTCSNFLHKTPNSEIFVHQEVEILISQSFCTKMPAVALQKSHPTACPYSLPRPLSSFLVQASSKTPSETKTKFLIFNNISYMTTLLKWHVLLAKGFVKRIILAKQSHNANHTIFHTKY